MQSHLAVRTSLLALLTFAGCGSPDRTPLGVGQPHDPSPPPAQASQPEAGTPIVVDSGVDANGDATSDAPTDTLDAADASDATPPNEKGCSEASKLVYVISQESDLYSFSPATLTFTKIGAVSCPATAFADGGTPKPQSMAVDRTGTAWVNYMNGELFKVSTADASCAATSFVPAQHGFVKFGMAFVADDPNVTSETLYVAGLTYASGHFVGKGLAKIDTTSLALTPIGDFSGTLAKQAAELSGTGAGKLYGFFTTSPASLASVDKTTGATSGDQSLTGVDVGDAWAFSFWGGDFWFYTAPSETSSPGSTSSVTRLHASSPPLGSIEVVMASIGFRIVGAGVSTCVPLQH